MTDVWDQDEDAAHLRQRCARIHEVLDIPVTVERLGGARTGAGFAVHLNQTEVLRDASYTTVAAYLDGIEHGAGWVARS
jgi:hypothetical protein